MLNKIFGNKKSNPISTVSTQVTLAITPPGPGQKQSRAVKIVHAGGHAEHYYMATPASWVMQKHPSFVLARPEIFRRPWDSVVRPDEILVPGQTYYIVPHRTVKKLRRRIRKPGATGPGFSLTENASQLKDKDSSLSSSFSGILVKPGIKLKARNRHVRFFGIETTDKRQKSDTISVKKSGKKSVRSANTQMHEKKCRARIDFAWEPALQSINE
ncbi:hypothetical protein C2S51_003647 [Perilla frutescens var. frutescens]|nr:hypothetical protein C2S51_003647 [Perilla frutescens var. frutescens]